MTGARGFHSHEHYVTDAELVHLKGLTQLQTLYLMGTGVTDAGVNQLKQSLPKCDIDH